MGGGRHPAAGDPGRRPERPGGAARQHRPGAHPPPLSGWVEAAEGVFVRRYEPWDVNVGAVTGGDGVLVIDTRADEQQAIELLENLREIDPRPPRWVVNTHSHFDHVGGNRSLRPAECWGHPSLGAVVDHHVDERTVINLGNRSVVVRHLGLGHTDGDLVVIVPDANVVFAGDLVEESAPPAYGDDSFPLDWPVTNARLLGLLDGRSRVVPGHGAVVDRRFVGSQQRKLVAVADTIRSLWVTEVAVSEALSAGGGRWPWPPGVLADAVSRGYHQLDQDRS